LPGMYSARGLLRQLQRLTTAGGSVAWGHTLLTTSVDFYSDLERKAGDSIAKELLATLANSVRQCAPSNIFAAYVEDGTFQILLCGKKAPAARAMAEQLATAFRADQFDRDPRARMSLTTAIVPWQLGVSPERLLEVGRETLAIAKQSGGDCIIDQGTFAQELSDWQNELTVGSPLANVVAQDIMEPFPYVLEQSSVNHAMLAALRGSGMPIWPFVNSEGRLVGVVTPSATDAAEWDHFHEEKLAPTKPITIAHNAPFPEIYETFSTEGCPEIVVVADNRPIGYLTFDGFISLIEPIHSATFSRDEFPEEDSRSLRVPSLVSVSERASGFDQ
jgi:GGDEF domain-containing protein